MYLNYLFLLNVYEYMYRVKLIGTCIDEGMKSTLLCAGNINGARRKA
jgi:hypothetical protein